MKLVIRIQIMAMIMISLVGFGLVGCDDTPTEVDNYQRQPVLSAFLINGQPFEEAWLERGAGMNDVYDMANAGIDDATMMISNLAGDTLLNLIPDPSSKGRYIPADGEEFIPQSRQTYKIEAWTTAPQNEYLWATALVPGMVEEHGPMQVFLVSDDLMDTTIVADGDTLNRTMNTMVWSWYDIDLVGGFQGIIIAQTPREDLIPLNPDWEPPVDPLNEDDDDYIGPEDRQRAGWTFMRHDQRQITLAWIFFRWEGPQKVQFNALSGAYYDYVFSEMQAEFGAIERPEFNINGGLGIFGAYSEQSINIYMEKVDIE